MNIYDAVIRLSGDTSHEVNKYGLTAPEIMVLRRIHGLDAVVRIVAVDTPANMRQISDRTHRDWLRKRYCDRKETENLVNELFGPDHIPLPKTLDADEEVQAELATRDRELKDTNTTTVTQEQLDAMIAKAVAAKLAAVEAKAPVDETPELSIEAQGPAIPLEEIDPDAPDPETGRLPDHVIAERDAKRDAGFAAKFAKE